jgi:hypothetical protein
LSTASVAAPHSNLIAGQITRSLTTMRVSGGLTPPRSKEGQAPVRVSASGSLRLRRRVRALRWRAALTDTSTPSPRHGSHWRGRNWDPPFSANFRRRASFPERARVDKSFCWRRACQIAAVASRREAFKRVCRFGNRLFNRTLARAAILVRAQLLNNRR